MFDKLLMFFIEIRNKDNWKYRWVKKLTYDKNKSLVGIYERKFAKNEIKEIYRNAKKKVISIKEYRYDDKEFLKKVVIKDGDGLIKYTNEIQYDDEYNISSILAVSKRDGMESSKLSLIDKNNRIVQEEFRFVCNEDEIISKRESIYDNDGNKNYKISGYELKEDCSFDMDNNILNIDYYDENNNNLGDIVYGFNDVLVFALNNKNLEDLEYEKEFKISLKELMEEEKLSGMECRNSEEKELNDVILQCIYKDKGQIQNVNFLKQGKIIYSNEYSYEEFN